MITWLTALRQWWASLPRTEQLSIVIGKRFPRKNTRKRKREPVEIVLHESTGRRSAYGVLKRRGLSVEYMIDRKGVVTQHEDPEKRSCLHAGGKHNSKSIGIEILNRYYGKYAKPDETVIKAHWAHGKKYILPTHEQVEAAWQLVCHLDILFETELRQFPGVDAEKGFRWGRSKYASKAPGTKAHHRWHHADALFIECYCACRDLGLSKAAAWQWTCIAAAQGKRYTTMPEPDLASLAFDE